jgi:hypothetical protein
VSRLNLATDLSASDSFFSLVLVASSADPDVFRSLHKYRLFFEKTLIDNGIAEKLVKASKVQQFIVDKFMDVSKCLHFMYKQWAISLPEKRRLLRRRNKVNLEDVPAKKPPSQYMVSSMKALPFATELARSRYEQLINFTINSKNLLISDNTFLTEHGSSTCDLL